MTLSTITALSPLDGRYASKVSALRPLLSEYGLMHRRVQVEVEWFIALSDAGLDGFAPLSEASRGLLRGDRKSTRLNSSHVALSRMPSSA